MRNCLKSFLIILLSLNALNFAQLNNPKNIKLNWKTDTTKHTINLSELMVVLPPGSFPKLDYPKFIGKYEGLKSFFKREPVMSVEINGEAKAYPLNMLSIHEISNDTLSGVPIVASYCPLCNSGLIFDRRLNFKGRNYLLEFAVSGMLRNSDMVMYDKQTESWWQQLMGASIVGKLAGAELKVIPSLIISVQEFFDRYPNGKILSKKSGDAESQKYYGTNFYKKYDDISGTPYKRFFNSKNIDPRLPALERIVNVSVKGKYIIYPFSVISKKGVINDSFKSKDIVIFFKTGTVSILDKKDISKSKDVGSVTVFSPVVNNMKLSFAKKDDKIVDTKTNSVWDITGKCIKGKLAGSQLAIEPYSTHFAFAWLAFHPESVIYKP